MPDNAHDPPVTPPADPLASGVYQPEPPIPAELLEPLRGHGHEKYALMKDRLGSEPLEVIRLMKHGGFRYKSKRGYPGVLVKRHGDPVPDRMSFRQIAPILSEKTGVEVTYETIRRWWELVFPGEPDETTDPDYPPVAPVVPVKRTVRRRTPAVVPAVGDEHADAIRAAMDRAKTTNPDVPPAMFLPPTDTQ
jgi:hypothetical protein